MSTAWYKPGVGPKLLQAFKSPTTTNNSTNRSIEIWNSTCAVTAFGKTTDAQCNVLINPANPQLLGVSKFPYFPKGGPAPKSYPKKDAHHIMGYVTQWGGMEVGDGMLFSANVVDGLVHQTGGWKLAFEIGLLPTNNPEENEKCPVGQAVVTGPGGADLRQHYEYIIHTVPPFYRHHPEPETHLLKCYENALALAFSKGSRVACPLLGAGARGFPQDVAIDLAVQASLQWRNDNNHQQENQSEGQALAFAIPDIEIAEVLLSAVHEADQQHQHQHQLPI